MRFLTTERKYLFKLKKYLPKFLRPKRQKVKVRDKDQPKPTVFLLAYCGKNYSGLNIAWGAPTIEMTLLVHLHKLGLIPPIEYGIQQKVSLKQVSVANSKDPDERALFTVCCASKFMLSSLRMMHNQSDVLERLNDALPSDIHVIDLKKCPHNFKNHKDCVSRTYSYTLPTLAFSPLEEKVNTEYRVNLATIERVNEVLEKFHGRHSFHNFTMHRIALEKDPMRQIYDFECGMPYVRDGGEFCEMRIKGTSFMMHQIRKMVGLTIAIVRGFCDEDVIELCWQENKVDIPKAPGLGLVLEKLYFFRPDDLFFAKNISEEKRTKYLKKMLEFRTQQIIPDIIKTEVEQTEMIRWLSMLPFYKYHEVELDGSGNASIWRLAKFVKGLRALDESVEDSDAVVDGVIVDSDDNTDTDHKHPTEYSENLTRSPEDSVKSVDKDICEHKKEKMRQQAG